MIAQKDCGVPSLLIILRQLGLRIIALKGQRARRSSQLKSNDEPFRVVKGPDSRGRPSLCKVASDSCSLTNHYRLSADIERIGNDIADFKDLLREVVAWGSENTGIPKRLLFRVALQHESFDRPEFLKAYGELHSLDNDKQTPDFWRTLAANNSDLLKSAKLLREGGNKFYQQGKSDRKPRISSTRASAIAEQIDKEDAGFKYLSAEEMAKEVARRAGTTCSGSTIAATSYWARNPHVKRRARSATAEDESPLVINDLLCHMADDRSEQVRLAIKVVEESSLDPADQQDIKCKLLSGETAPLEAIEIARMAGAPRQSRKSSRFIREQERGMAR